MLKKILLVGCGQMGSRHLQAVSVLGMVNEVHVVDNRKESLALGKTRIAQVTELNKKAAFYWHGDFNHSIPGGELCIIATHAKGRGELVKMIREKYGCKNFIIEKLVSQSVAEYRQLMDYCRKEQLSIWVNCPVRAYQIHKYVKSRISADGPIIFSDIGGNQGLACNGVHPADLFLFLTGEKKINLLSSRIDPILHASKRGDGFFDLSGTLYGATDQGSDFFISFSGKNSTHEHFSIFSENSRSVIDHVKKCAFENSRDNDWEWQKIPFEENIYSSRLTGVFVTDIFNKGSCDLPTLEECFPAHEFILGSLLEHFNRLSKSTNDYCPVT